MATNLSYSIRTEHALVAAALMLSALACAQDVAGEWHGAIEIENDAPLRLALHISRGNSAGLTATIDSIDEGGMDLPLDSIAVSGALLKFGMQSVGGEYEGRIDANGSTIAGSWSQNGATWPLTWYRGEDPGVTLRPCDEEEARRKGRIYTQWFYEGKASDLWTRLSPVMQQTLESPKNLYEFNDRTLRGIGKESSLTRESVSLSGAIRVYRRLAEFNKSDDVEITFGFDSRGAIAQFEVRSGEKQYRPL